MNVKASTLLDPNLRKSNKETETSDKGNKEDVNEDSFIVASLLKSMSLRDKIAQMSQIDINMLLKDDGQGGKIIDMDQAQHWIGDVGIGSVLNTPSGVAWTAEQYRQTSLQLQALVVQRGSNSSDNNGDASVPIILPIWGLDSVHGANYVHGATLTPQPINLAATFNLTCSKQAGALASRDTRAAGISWLFSPLLGIALEPRWSRVYETFGEDPYLVGRMAQAMIAGIQTQDDGSSNTNSSNMNGANPRRAAACAKHFVGYSMPRTGHDRSPSWIPTRHLYQYFVPPWKRVLQQQQEGGQEALTVMESYTETDGVPNIANRATTKTLLRQELQYDGVLVTDYEEMRNLFQWHHVAPNTTAAIVTSIRESSIDMSMIPWAADEFGQALEEAVEKHLISVERIDESVTRLLKLKLQLDLIGSDRLLTEQDPNLELVGSDREVALDMARQSVVLVQNNKDILPLENLVVLHNNGATATKVLVVGPTSNAAGPQSGGWTGQWQGVPATEDPSKWFTYGTTVLEAVQALQNDSNKRVVEVIYRCGVDIIGRECSDPNQEAPSSSILEQVKGWIGLGGPHEARNSIGRAVEQAQHSDVILVCVGEEPYAEKPGDIRSLRLPQGQYDLVKALRAANASAKIVLVYMGGRPRLLADMVGHVDAVLLAFLPGPDAGQAVVDIIVGKSNPSGRLPITYPLEEDGGGIPYFRSISDQCTRDDPNTPLPHFEYVPCTVQWEFGHGLSYTTFEYSNISATGGIDRDLTVQVTVTNTGNRVGYETILVFTFDEFRSTTPEYKRLRAFQKVELQPNESITIQETISLEDLKFIGPHDDHHYIVDPQMITWVGVGKVDCRTEPSSNLCVRLESPNKNEPYVAACDAACQVWTESGCASQFGLTSKSCWNACLAISECPMSNMQLSNDGWGWNYVNCIESVSRGLQSSFGDGSSCSKMTRLCRNIFQTGTLDEFGFGQDGAGDPAWSMAPPVGNYTALVTALLATGIMVFFMNGGKLRRRNQDNHIQLTTRVTPDEEEYR